PGHRHVAAAGPHHGDDRRRPGRAHRGHARGHGVLQEDHRGSGGAARRRTRRGCQWNRRSLMRVTDRLRQIVPPIVVAVVFILAWEAFVNIQDIKPYLLPAPSLIWDQLTGNREQIWKAAQATGTNALVGLVLGTAWGVVAAVVASRSRWISDMTIPVAA